MARPLPAVLEDYVELFQAEPPTPFGINDDRLAEVMDAAIRKGEPIPDDFDWWGALPSNADA